MLEIIILWVSHLQRNQLKLRDEIFYALISWEFPWTRSKRSTFIFPLCWRQHFKLRARKFSFVFARTSKRHDRIGHRFHQAAQLLSQNPDRSLKLRLNIISSRIRLTQLLWRKTFLLKIIYIRMKYVYIWNIYYRS